MKQLAIFGAGFAGLLAGQMFRQVGLIIYESQKELPNNHSAVLRFRNNAIEKYTGIDLKEIEIRKSIFMYHLSRKYCLKIKTMIDANEYERELLRG